MTPDFRAMCAELVELCTPVDSIPQLAERLQKLNALADRARALLAQPVAEGPSDDELDELFTEIDQSGEALSWRLYARAALARWGRPTPQPVAVSERLPEPSVKVLAYYFNALGKGRTICAIWVPAKSRSDEGDDFLEYDEEGDKYYWPEGWYEAIENWDELGWAKVYEGEIVYWQPLPKWPANALPTPEATND